MAKAQALVLAFLLATLPLAVSAADAVVPAAGVDSRIDAIKRRGTLRVAVIDEYPWLKKDPDANGPPFIGPAWLLAEEYAKRLGVKIETTPVMFDNKVSVVTSGQVDITVVPLLQTPEREKIVDMILYSKAAHCLFGLADNPKVASAKTFDDLNRADVTIAFIADTPQGRWLQNRLPLAKPRGVLGNIADIATDEVVSGRADVAPIDQFFFTGLANKTPGLASVPPGPACLDSQELTITLGMAINKNQPAFLAWLRGVAAEIKPQVDAEMLKLVRMGS